MNVSKLLIALIIASTTFLCTACYRMPTDDDYSLVPTTNNPSVTCEKNDSMLPGLGY